MKTSERKRLLVAACECDRVEFLLARQMRRGVPGFNFVTTRWVLPFASLLLPRKYRFLGAAMRLWARAQR